MARAGSLRKPARASDDIGTVYPFIFNNLVGLSGGVSSAGRCQNVGSIGGIQFPLDAHPGFGYRFTPNDPHFQSNRLKIPRCIPTC